MELCARLPMHVVTRGIGMSGEAALTFREHLLRGANHHAPIEERAKAQGEVARMLRALIAERRAEPRDDVISGLIHNRSEEHTSGLQSLMRISYAVFCLKKKNTKHT